MTKIIISFLILAATTFVAGARSISVRSYDQMGRMSDIIVVAKPISTKYTAERTNLPYISPDIPIVGLSSEFEVSLVLKGDTNLTKLVVHHYRLAKPVQWVGQFALASFDPKDPANYLLFLKREPDGRYAPLDQVDPAWTSILKLNGAGWDKMKFEDFKEWLDAKKWLFLSRSSGSGATIFVAGSQPRKAGNLTGCLNKTAGSTLHYLKIRLDSRSSRINGW
jgi:hypothetical protein